MALKTMRKILDTNGMPYSGWRKTEPSNSAMKIEQTNFSPYHRLCVVSPEESRNKYLMKYPFLPFGSSRAVRLRSPTILFPEGSLQHKGSKKVFDFFFPLQIPELFGKKKTKHQKNPNQTHKKRKLKRKLNSPHAPTTWFYCQGQNKTVTGCN